MIVNEGEGDGLAVANPSWANRSARASSGSDAAPLARMLEAFHAETQRGSAKGTKEKGLSVAESRDEEDQDPRVRFLSLFPSPLCVSA